jgi:hypothetical protein
LNPKAANGYFTDFYNEIENQHLIYLIKHDIAQFTGEMSSAEAIDV